MYIYQFFFVNVLKIITLFLIMEYKTFENLNLNKSLVEGIYLYGYAKPSSIQIKGIESINTGKDCLLQSQSGTGKTATYLLGVLNRLEENNMNQCIILTPTRELAKQVYDVASKLAKNTKLTIECCLGGTNIYETKNLLRKANLIIGTLGRIHHMIQDKVISTNTLKLVVIDEADEMLNKGFK